MPSATAKTIESHDELLEYLASGCRPAEQWRLGTEHEKFGFTRDDLRPLPYEGPRGIRAVLEGLAERHGWTPVLEDGQPIALLENNGSSITLEPGGQLELSGALLETLHETCREVSTHLKQVKAVAEPLGIAFFGASVDPFEANKKFAEEVGAKYPLLCDTDKSVAKAFGVLGPRNVAQRWTFYVDKEGIVRHIDKKVNVSTHGKDVAAKSKDLGFDKT